MGAGLERSTRRNPARTPAAQRQRPEHERMAETELRGFEQTVDQAAQPQRDQQRAGPVQFAGRRAGRAVGDAPVHHAQDKQGQRRIEEEHPAPRAMVNNPPPDNEAQGRRDRNSARPGANRPTALPVREGGPEQGQAVWDQQGAAHALSDPGDDQGLDVGRQTTAQRSQGKHADAGGKARPASQPVTQRAADQEQRGQKQDIRLHHPLGLAERRLKFSLHDRQGDIHHAAVDKHHAGAQNRGRQGPLFRTPARRRRLGP